MLKQSQGKLQAISRVLSLKMSHKLGDKAEVCQWGKKATAVQTILNRAVNPSH